MASTIILLYALQAITGAVPDGCFVAAWIILAARVVIGAAKDLFEKYG